jgi:hypothetical protein
MDKKKILQRDQTESKTFTYSKGGVVLNFTLRVDIKQEMKDFIECLEAATLDVKKVLEEKK